MRYVILFFSVLFYINICTNILKNKDKENIYGTYEEKIFTETSIISLLAILTYQLWNPWIDVAVQLLILLCLTIILPLLKDKSLIKIHKAAKNLTLTLMSALIKFAPVWVLAALLIFWIKI